MLELSEAIEKFKEKEDSDNFLVRALFHLINNTAYGIYIIFLLIVIMGAFVAAAGLLLGTPFLSLSLFEDGHMISGSVVAIISLAIWGTAFRIT